MIGWLCCTIGLWLQGLRLISSITLSITLSLAGYFISAECWQGSEHHEPHQPQLCVILAFLLLKFSGVDMQAQAHASPWVDMQARLSICTLPSSAVTLYVTERLGCLPATTKPS
jgi:hypothetical protein